MRRVRLRVFTNVRTATRNLDLPLAIRDSRSSASPYVPSGVSVVHLLRQAEKVSDGHECAYANESRQADGEEYPQKLDLLGFEVDDPHCSSARQLLVSGNTARHCGGEKASGA